MTRDATTPLIIVPGLNDSGPAHWQTWLECETPAARRILLGDWRKPDLRAWTQAVLAELLLAEEESIIVAHSFGCLAAIRAVQRSHAYVKGVLLVAPADPSRFDLDPATFHRPLPIRSLVIGSENDPWMTCWAARQLADSLQGDFINLGNAGHINASSGYGQWPGVTLAIAGLEKPRVRSFRNDRPAASAATSGSENRFLRRASPSGA